MYKLAGALILLAALPLAGCGQAKLQEQDEAVRAAWADMANLYQRRVDLVPTLVEQVAEVTGAETPEVAALGAAGTRARALPATSSLLDDPAAFARFQAAQVELTQSLAQLQSAAGSNEDLQADPDFIDLHAQVKTLDGEIARASDRYEAAVRSYNSSVNDFPSNLAAGMYDFDEMPSGKSAGGEHASPAPQAAGL